MAPRNVPISDQMSRFTGNWDKMVGGLTRSIKEELAGGATARQAVRRAFAAQGVRGKLEDTYLQGIMDIVRGPMVITDPKALRKWWLNKKWPGEELSLSQRISKAQLRAPVVQTISRNMREGKSWQALARSLTDAKLIKADVAGHTWDLIKQSRRTLSGDPAAIRAYQSAVHKSQRQINRLARAGAPTSRLKKAYQNVIKVTEKGTEEALNKAIGRAVNAKARYNAERIARTEYAKAYGEGFKAELEGDEDAIGFRSVLGSRHPEMDICDHHAEVDAFDMGPGVYPKDQGPPYPYHPHCNCLLNNVYKLKKGTKQRDTPDPKATQKFLQEQPIANRKKLLGAEGAKAFNKKPGTWQRNMKHWAGVDKSTRRKVPGRFAHRRKSAPPR